jgi:hypothetical protein
MGIRAQAGIHNIIDRLSCMSAKRRMLAQSFQKNNEFQKGLGESADRVNNAQEWQAGG